MNEPAAPIVVPATSANLGCGFDCAALALNLYLKVRGRLAPGPGFRIAYQGADPERVPLDDSNLVARAACHAARAVGAEIAGGEIEIDNGIPLAAGFGSSAAAIVAGILLAARQFGRPSDPETIVALAAELEGHPDNVAGAYHGGLVLAAQEESGRVRVARAAVPQDLDFIAVVPAFAMPTERARAVLPAAYPRPDAVANLQRVALLAATCFSGEFQLDPELFRDRLHQPYRAPLVPGLEACFRLRHPDLLGVFLSGAGSSVLAIARRNAAEIGRLLCDEFARHGLAAEVRLLKAENRGARDFFDAG
ncbi:MAG TPA: homoserine kinase [Candidatus Acidoferrales bacterium]|nr:homoserine kinase [Candidatus Acidoferrales bacterium]